MENLPIIISIISALVLWTVSVVGVVLWLTKQFKETRHTLQGSMDMRYAILDQRVKDIELRNARKNGVV